MARKYQRYRRRKQNVTNDLLFLGAAGGLLVIGAATSSGGGFSSRTVLALLLIGSLAAAAVLGYAFYIDFRRQKALRLLDLAAVDTMSGLEFEKWVGAQLQARGYRIKFTPINDYGVDIVARKERESEPLFKATDSPFNISVPTA